MNRLIPLTCSCLMTIVACFASANAQRGEITGRVVAEDGGGLPNITVILSPASGVQRSTTGNRFDRVVTDEEGNFKFTGLTPRSYMVNVAEARGYVRSISPTTERQNTRYSQIGDNVTISLIRGGVITGRVTNLSGEPMIAVRITATMVRDAEGRSLSQQFSGRSHSTDDRGVYRLFGLMPGTYIVSSQNTGFGYNLSPYDGDVPTYHPSSTRDTATEIVVTSGGEVIGVDIRYRGEHGHVISGTVIGGGEPSQPYAMPSVTLVSVATGYVASGAGAFRSNEGNNGFAIFGVTDGEYDLIARRGGYNEEEALASAPRRVTVKGSDVGGIELKLAPLGSIKGKTIVEISPSSCESIRKSAIEEIVMTVRRDPKSSTTANPFLGAGRDDGVNEKGEFTVTSLDMGRYFMNPRLPSENWYLKSITAAGSVSAAGPARGSAAAAKSVMGTNLARDGIALRAGERRSGITVTVSDGAAALRGKLAALREGESLPSRMRIHLIPAEMTAVDDVLRYAETQTRGEGAFAFTNIAPGRYLLLARPVPDSEPVDRPPAPAAWDAGDRAKLKKEAEARKFEVELKPCQRATDQLLKF